MRRKQGPSPVQIMACRLFGAKPILLIRPNFNEMIYEFHTFSFKNMQLKMASILSRPQYVNCYLYLVDVASGYQYKQRRMSLPTSALLKLFRGHRVHQEGNGVYRKSGEILPKPIQVRFAITKLFIVTSLGVYLGMEISKVAAMILEEMRLFSPVNREDRD